MNNASFSIAMLRDPVFLGQRFDDVVERSPKLFGLASAVPEVNDTWVSSFAGDDVILTRAPNCTVDAKLNACRHRNGQLIPVGMVVDGKKITRKGKTLPNGNRMCQWHRWVYAPSGELFHAPTFRGAELPCPKANALHDVPVEMVGDLVFEAGKGAKEHLADVFESDGFKKLGIIPFRFPEPMGWYQPKDGGDSPDETFHTSTFMEVYGDTDHVDDIHKDSFNQLVDMASLFLEFGAHWSVQFVGWRKDTTRVCQEYARYRDLVLDRSDDLAPKFGAIWMAYGPDKTFEWYPLGRGQYAFVASTCIPLGRGCKNIVEFFFPERVLLDEPELAEALCAAYNVTAVEDRYLCNSMEVGRSNLIRNGRGSDLLGPAHKLQEGCVTHYYNLLRCYLEGVEPTKEAVAV